MATYPDFWQNFFDESDDYNTGPPLTEEMVRTAESQLGYKLPACYLQLFRVKDGEAPKRRCFPTGQSDWADDHVEVIGIRGIGGTWGIDSEQRGSLFMIRTERELL